MVDSVRSSILTSINSVQEQLYSRTTCVQFGNGLLAVQKSVCGNFLQSLDAMWLAYAVVTWISVLAMPAMIWSVNTIWADKYVRVSPGDISDEPVKLSQQNGGYKILANEEITSPQKQQIVINIR